MKNIIKKIKKALVWTCSSKVLDAINSGASYEEVDALVERLTEKKGSAPAKDTLPTSEA